MLVITRKLLHLPYLDKSAPNRRSKWTVSFVSVYARRLAVPRHPTNVTERLPSMQLSTQLPAP